MAKVTEAKLTKRINTGEYEFEEYTLTAEVEAKETGAEALAELKESILEAFVGGESKPAAAAAPKKDSKKKPSKKEEPVEEEEEEAEEEEEEEEEKKPAKKGGKKFVKKPQAYNRGIEQHKEIFSSVLKAISPDWKKSDATKAKAKKASEKLEGEEFLDENGEVVDSFKALVKKAMGGKK